MKFSFKDNELQLVRKVGGVADKLGVPAYLVGGFVRDRLLDRHTTDWDIVCVGDGVLLATEVAKELNITNDIVVYQRFGTAMIRYQGIEIEFVGARKESYSADSRKPSVTPGTLEDDQNRRDFSINAMAVAINSANFGQLLDPFDGIGDLTSKTIRTPLDPDRTFSDDPLRMMRAVRFAAQLNFKIDEPTFKGIQENAHRLEIVSPERISTELNKIISSPHPAKGLDNLSEAGLLKIFFPEFEKLRGVEVINNIGHKDNYYHTLKVLENLSELTDDLWLRWAAILHDIAKPDTKKFVEGTGWTFHGHEVVGARMVYKIFKRLRLPLDHKMKYVQKLVRLHLRPISLTNEDITDSAIRRLLFDAGDDIDDLMLLCKADITSKNEMKVKRIKNNYDKVKQKLVEVEEKDHIRNWQPPIDGQLIMQTFDLKPGRIIGEIKDSIKEAIIEGDIPNNYDAAYNFMLKKAEELGVSAK